MRKIFTLIVAMVMTLPLMATEITKAIDFSGLTSWETTTGSGVYVATWTSETNTLTFNKAWGGASLWYGETTPLDATGYEKIILELNSGATTKVKFAVNYVDGSENDAYIESGNTSATVNMTGTSIKSISIYEFGGNSNISIVLKSMYLSGQSGTKKTLNVWNGSNNFGDWSWETRVEAGADKFTKAAVGSKLTFTFSANTGATDNWYQMKTMDGNGTVLTSNAAELSEGVLSFSETTTSYTMELNSDDVTALQTYGIRVQGHEITMTNLDLIYYEEEPEPEETDTIWKGTQVMPAEWGKYISIGADKFAKAEAGWTLRCMATAVGSGAQAQFGKPSPWTAYEGKDFGGRYCDFTLTEAQVNEMKIGGCYVSGCGYTLTAVRLFDPSTQVSYTSSINIEQKDWTWTDTKPVIGLKITNPAATAATVPVEIELTTDKNEAIKTYKQNVDVDANADKEVSFTLDDIENPGIYRFTAYVNDEQVSYTRPEDQAYTWTTLNIAYKPTEIVSPVDAQADFKEYWEGVKAQLAAIPMNAQLELVTEGQYRNLYKVTLNSIPNGTTGDPIQIRGYYAEVKAEGTYPTVVNFQGYDSGGTGDLWIPGADDQQDYNTLVISARGQSYGNRDPYKADNIYCNPTDEDKKDFNIKQGWWFTYHFGNLDSYYYRGAYMDQVRGIDFVYSRDKVDKNNIFVTGGSQGGAFTLVATALCGGKVNAIAPAIQFMGDFTDYFQVGNWPVSEAKAAAAMQGMSDEEMYRFLSYYDTKNFASMISAPTLSSIGLQDNVCPAHTNLAPYNLLTCEKELYINKNLVHEVPYLGTNNSSYDWNTLTTGWWEKHMKHPQSAETGASAWEAAAGKGAVQYTQTLAYGKYSTICLPYNAKATGAVVMNLVNKTEVGGVLQSLIFQYNGATEAESINLIAGRPYLIRSTAENGNVTYTRTDTEEAGDVASVALANGFTGVYSNTMVAQGDYYLYTDETAGTQYFAPSNGFVSAAPFRAYIKSSDLSIIEPKADDAKVKVTLGFNGATAINSISAANIQAVQPTGKYIINGRLIIAKDGKEYNTAGAQLK